MKVTIIWYPACAVEVAGQICSWPSPTSAHLLCPTAILSELLQRENRVLHFWTLKKRRLDQCQQYVVFERSAKQVCPEPSPALPHFWGCADAQMTMAWNSPEEGHGSRQSRHGQWCQQTEGEPTVPYQSFSLYQALCTRDWEEMLGLGWP